MSRDGSEGDTDVSADRRTYLAAVASASAASVSGCLTGGDGGDGDDEHGERVPEIFMEFSEGLGNFSEIQRDMAEIAANNISERLGIPVESRAKEFLTLLNERIADERTGHLHADGFNPVPANLDPTNLGGNYHIENAGDVDGYNPVQYHSCEFSQLIEDARFAESEEEFERATTEAQQVFSEDIGKLPVMTFMAYSAINTDHIVVDEDLVGEQGVTRFNIDFYTNLESVGDTIPSVDISVLTLQTMNHPMIDHPNHITWANMIFSPLYRYDQNWEFKPVLAEDYEVENDFQTVRITLRDDATFHNGEPITAEDVKFTWDLYYSPYDTYVGADYPWEIDSIEVVDERTVEWNFPASNPTFMERDDVTTFGILPKDIWEEKLDGDFENLPEITWEEDEVVGSGPYELDSFQTEQFALLTPFEGHHETPNQPLRWQAYTDSQAAYRDFEQGELSVFEEPSAAQYRELRELDHVSANMKTGINALYIMPQLSFPPFQFREIRLACSQVLNREEMNQVTQHGDAETILEAHYLSKTHPAYPDEGMTQIAPSPQGDEEVGRETLREAGYTWDDDGRLRYPPDKDLSPPWPQGESPMDYPEEWPCVEDIPEGY